MTCDVRYGAAAATYWAKQVRCKSQLFGICRHLEPRKKMKNCEPRALGCRGKKLGKRNYLPLARRSLACKVQYQSSLAMAVSNMSLRTNYFSHKSPVRFFCSLPLFSPSAFSSPPSLPQPPLSFPPTSKVWTIPRCGCLGLIYRERVWVARIGSSTSIQSQEHSRVRIVTILKY